MNIKDSILTGFGAGLLASKGKEGIDGIKGQMQVYMEDEPQFDIEDKAGSYLFYLGTEDTFSNMLYEYVSERFFRSALALADKDKRVYVVTKNLVMPSYSELEYEKARRAGVIFIHLEEGEGLTIGKEGAVVSGNSRVVNLKAERVLLMDDMALPIKDKEFLSFYRSEPQLRWSPTRWNRGRYHAGFIRHPREKRWHEREVIAAIGEQIIDKVEERVLPEVTEERCSGCASCKNACPHDAIEIGHELMDVAIFGILGSTTAPKAKINEEICMGCGLCASTCPSDAITHPTTDTG
jgi:Pyruvate/2-oxoacid:ferredoxin oxidoreductase delta subunit